LTSAVGRTELVIAKEAPAGVTVTVAEAESKSTSEPPPTLEPFLSACWTEFVAVMMTRVVLVTLGAVKNPLLEILPALADQVTGVLEVPRVRNCTCSIAATDALPGEIESAVGEADAEVPALCKAALHAAVRPVRHNNRDKTTKFGIRVVSIRYCLATSKCLTLHIQVSSRTEFGGTVVRVLSQHCREGKAGRADYGGTRPKRPHKYITNVPFTFGFKTQD
jgi:hypothetical protein